MSYAIVPERAIIKVEGTDKLHFLQGLITQDIETLNIHNMLYGAMLTPQGKYLYDFFITAQEEFICLEGDKQQMTEMVKKLTLHKLRSDVSLTLEDHNVFVSFDEGDYADPRHQGMGYRSYKQPIGTKTTMDAYNQKRITLAIPDGTTDLTPGKSSPFEGNLDLINGISFSKGCYMGQELVSRIHHRGLVKRRLTPLPDEAGQLKLMLDKVT